MLSELSVTTRVLRRRPMLSGAIILTIGLAIAASTVAFAVVDGVLLEPLPYAEPERLVTVWERNVPRDQQHNVVSPANFLAWRERLRSVDVVAALVSHSLTLTGDGEPERVGVVNASAAYFRAVGGTPLLGRLYDENDDAPDATTVAVLSEGFWRRRFGSDSSVVGRTLTLNRNPVVVVGVLPARYDFNPRFAFSATGARDLWLPQQFPPAARTAGGRYLQVIARLAPSATVASAQQEASTLARRLEREFPERQTGWDVNVVGLRTELVGEARRTILVVFGAICFVLLIACANVANLLLARAGEREQEMAVRAALGAQRRRLVRQLMLESLLLAMAGCVLGLGLAWWGIRALVAAAPELPRVDQIGLDGSVTGFAVLATLATALLFGLAPAIHASRSDLAGWLSQRAASGTRLAVRMRGALVAVQVGLSFVLLVGAGLLVRSLLNRMAVGVGVEVERVLTAETQLPSAVYGTPAARSAFYEGLVSRIAQIPGVTGAGAISILPLSGNGQATSFWVLDRPLPGQGQFPVADVRWVHWDYHAALGIPLREGRLFDARDRADAPRTVLVSEAGARVLWPGESAVGKRIAMEWGDTLRAEVIGVVGDVRHTGPDEPPTRTTLYWDYRQSSSPSRMTLVARTRGPAEALGASLRSTVWELDPNLPLYNVRTMESLLGDALARARFTTAALGAFSVLALVLATLGLYGVMAYVTQLRAREIGIRIALGADRRSVLRMVLRQGVGIVGGALLLGGVGALALSGVLGSLVYDVSVTDPVTFALVGGLLAAAGLVACWLPARRASGIDPIDAIRRE